MHYRYTATLTEANGCFMAEEAAPLSPGREGSEAGPIFVRPKLALEAGFKKVLTLLHKENIELRARLSSVERTLHTRSKAREASVQTEGIGASGESGEVLARIAALEDALLTSKHASTHVASSAGVLQTSVGEHHKLWQARN